ncbi:hypothetical protein A2707_02330 [Candidatus Saccharibacteria bacterium RIFCSPHIGHO2_01_FULL_45_15]|nr:MAG: hypothetical protein A2707_02330 [Candidatus Saccharibacteria bacterium RIFCSPHIGHO2_01_FULL_45_15]OGL28786.1 MAG: hypothetical protein A3C39_00165 [Candidatus Saccharibacteria bacterium RIFCSPHIGHO2_02_FULL_46_12]OGL32574.1 MAG: hypothetical protein A3E76_06390 [Candidatus Saccharibacteria bacterium RIFCSPHIGHO2_12_FULL_44_22]
MARGEIGSGDESIKLTFDDLDHISVNLSDSSVDDIKTVFDATFEYINTNQKLIEFELDDTTDDLFNQVSKDIIEQINREVLEARQNFTKIWDLIPEMNT